VHAAFPLALLFVCSCSVSTGTANGTNTAVASNTTRDAATRPTNAVNTSTATSGNSAPANTSDTAPAPAADDVTQDFTLVNSTGVEINKLYVSPHEKDDWEEDVLGQDTLPSGQSVHIKFKREEEAAMWDLRVEDTQGNFIVWENLNLLEISKVTLYYENGKARAVVE
jgi:hypothetical protein